MNRYIPTHIRNWQMIHVCYTKEKLIDSARATTIDCGQCDTSVLSLTSVGHRCIVDGVKRGGVIERSLVRCPPVTDDVIIRIADCTEKLNRFTLIDRLS